jgi:hypothetical protein
MKQSKKGYSYTTAPVGITNKKPKYRDPYNTAVNESPSNIMWDKRVFRGNTYASQVLPISVQVELEVQKEKEKAAARTKKIDQIRKLKEVEKSTQESETDQSDLKTQQSNSPKEQYLEIIKDREVETDTFTGTDYISNKPPEPIFVPAKSGIDVSTQIEDDIFNFDHEVEPILEVLVGKTLEQSLLEVLMEEEIATMKESQKLFEQVRNVELVEVQKMNAMEVRRIEEKENRIKQEKSRLQKENQAKEKIASRAFTQTFFSNLETKVLTKLDDQGFFYDVVHRNVEKEFMPWLIERVQMIIEQKRTSRQMVDDLIKMTVKQLLDNEITAREERKRLIREEENVNRQKDPDEQEENFSESYADLESTMVITSDMLEQDYVPNELDNNYHENL